jgi:hypothetical protein
VSRCDQTFSVCGQSFSDLLGCPSFRAFEEAGA